MKRRSFIRNLSASGLLLLANGAIKSAPVQRASTNSNAGVFRFAISSDGHYGEPNTEFDTHFDSLVQSLNGFHAVNPLQACIINGDIIHNNPTFLPPAAARLRKMEMPLYVSKGNHDMVTDQIWEETWKMGVNHDVVIGNQVFLLGTTSNEKGTYLCPNTDWFRERFKQYSDAQNLFLFVHITPAKWTKYGVDCPAFLQLLKETRNVRAVFNGHDHNVDGVKMLGRIPFLFDGHFGGSWGTAYRGYRVVEVNPNNSLFTYMMSPVDKMAELAFYADENLPH